MLFNKRRIRCLGNVLVLILSFLIMIILGEILLRTWNPALKFLWPEKMQFRLNLQDLTKSFLLDPEFGFRPILGSNDYNMSGTQRNEYGISKKKGIVRLLFLGDSVAARGKIINALRQLYGEDKFEYWNAGVESFDTTQEVRFYEKYNYKIRPDHVVLFFSNNDFETTPVAFLNKENRIVVYSPYSSTAIVWRWLFAHSCIYRFVISNYLQLSYKKDNYDGINREKKQEVEDSLKRLKSMLDIENIRFTVVVLPIIDKLDKWSTKEKESRAAIINILQELSIKYFDLLEVNLQFISEFPEIIDASIDKDRWHPGEKLSFYYASFLYKKKIFP